MSLHTRMKRHKGYLTHQAIQSFGVAPRQFTGESFSRAALRYLKNQGALKMSYGTLKNGQVKCIWELNQ